MGGSLGGGADLDRRDRAVLEAERALGIDSSVNGLQLGVLEDEADLAGEPAGRGRDDVQADDLRVARDEAAVEMRYQSVEDAQPRRLAATRWAGDHGQPAVEEQRSASNRG